MADGTNKHNTKKVWRKSIEVSLTKARFCSANTNFFYSFAYNVKRKKKNNNKFTPFTHLSADSGY